MCRNSQSGASRRRGLDANPQLHIERRASSLSRDDTNSEFEFSEVVYTDEPPLSPKLLAFSPPWESSAYTISSIDMVPSAVQHQYCRPAKDDDEYMVWASGRCDQYTAGHVINPSADQDTQKKRVDLRSLMLQRRELEQLPPLIGADLHHGIVDVNAAEYQKPALNLSSSPSTSSSSASSSNSSPVSSTASSPPQSSDVKKSRRWSFKLDFLHFNKASCPSSKAVDLRHRKTYHGAANIHELGDGDDDDYAIFESPRRSTCSLNSSISSSATAVRREKEMSAGARPPKMKVCASAPVSRAASPSRAPVAPPAAHLLYTNGHVQARTGVKMPMSPHAQHYQQRRASAEELRRRTFLPYRQSLLGACFFHSPPRPRQVGC